MKKKIIYLIMLLFIAAFSFTDVSSQTLTQVTLPVGYSYRGFNIAYGLNMYFKLYDGTNSVLAKYDGTTVTIIPNPAGMTNQDGMLPVVYNSKLYLRYNNGTSTFLYSYDGTTFTQFAMPVGMTIFYENGIVFNSKLYLQYADASFNNWLYEFNGTTLTQIAMPAGMTKYTGPSIIYNSNMYMKYTDGTSAQYLYKFDGTTFTQIATPAGMTRCESEAIVYNSKLCVRYSDGTNEYMYEYNGTALTPISNPAGMSKYLGRSIIFNSILHTAYGVNMMDATMYKYDGTTLTQVPNPAGLFYNSSGVVYNSKLYVGYRDASFNSSAYEYDGTTLTTLTNPAGMTTFGGGFVYNSKLYLSFGVGMTSYLYNFTPASSAIIWDGTAWSNTTGPTATDDAIIDGLYDETANIVCKDLTINSGKNLEIQPTFNVTVNGNLINNGSVILKSANNLTASGSLITLGTITNNGTMESNRYVVGGRYHLLGSPLNSTINVSAPFASAYVWTYSEGVNATVDNDLAWTQLTNSNTITSGKGILVKSVANDVVNFDGTFNNGIFTINNLPKTYQGYSLISNPYPSSIDWNAASGWTKTNIFGTTWVWNESVSTTAYATWDGSTGVNGGSRYIQPMQGFFVQATVNNAILGFTNAVRIHNTENFKSELNNLIKVTVSGNSLNDEIALYFDENTNDDSEKFMSWTTNIPQIYSIENNKKIAINKLQDV